jgi:hypothetical protein
LACHFPLLIVGSDDFIEGNSKGHQQDPLAGASELLRQPHYTIVRSPGRLNDLFEHARLPLLR